MTDAKKALIALLGILVVFIGLSTWSCTNSRGAAKDRAEAARLTAVNQGLEQAVEITKKDKAIIEQENIDLTAKVADLSSRRPPAPPKPGPAPVTDPELASALLAKGLSVGVAVQMGTSSVLIPTDARKVWSWAEDAARVPGFETKSAADDVLIAAHRQLETGLRAELAKTGEVVVLRESQLGVVGQEVSALRKENDHLLKVQVAEKFKTRIKIGAGIALGGGIVYLIRK